MAAFKGSLAKFCYDNNICCETCDFMMSRADEGLSDYCLRGADPCSELWDYVLVSDEVYRANSKGVCFYYEPKEKEDS